MASVRKRVGTKFWIGCFSLPNGDRKQRSTKCTRKAEAQKVAEKWEHAAKIRATSDQAQRVLAEIVKEVSGETFVLQDARDYMAMWLARKRLEVEPNTATRYERVIADFQKLVPEETPFANLTKATVAKFRDAVAERTSISSANLALTIVKVLFAEAWNDGVIALNGAVDVKPLNARKERAARAQRRPFRPHELTKLIEATPVADEWYGMQLFGYYSGQRLSDIARVRREEISPFGIWEGTSKKTKVPIRVALPDVLMGWIEQHAPANGFLFPVSAATERTGTLSNRFYAIMHRAGLVPARAHRRRADGQGRAAARGSSEISFHCFRHTTQTRLIEAGVSRPMAMAYVGHEDEDTSKDYTHIGVEALRGVMLKLPDITKLAA